MIDHLHIGPLAGSDLEAHIARDEVIPQGAAGPDKEYPEVTWCQFGIVPTIEVAVVARCGALAFFAKAPSWLVVPVMADRVFGTDVADIQLGQDLADHLWDRHGAELIAEAMRQRGRSDT